jgi:ferrochelatase
MLGILLVNLGSPNSPDPADVKEYLREFLNDPYVVDLPAPIRWFLVNVLILNTRPKKSAEAYAKIWSDRGSPLLDYTAKLTQKVQSLVPAVPVEMGMRYGCPCIESGVTRLLHRGVTEIVLVPLYPQYSYAASETAIVEFERILARKSPNTKTYVVQNFHQHPAFVAALTESMKPTLAEFQPDLLLFSYHGIPNQQRFKTRNQMDYREQCYATTDALKATLGIDPSKIETSFQSRLGPTKWIEPYTDHVLAELPKRGVKRLAVASPSFTADCLETLEEIQIRYDALFRQSGGAEFRYIPCVNDSDAFARAVIEIARDHIPKGKSL